MGFFYFSSSIIIPAFFCLYILPYMAFPMASSSRQMFDGEQLLLQQAGSDSGPTRTWNPGSGSGPVLFCSWLPLFGVSEHQP